MFGRIMRKVGKDARDRVREDRDFSDDPVERINDFQMRVASTIHEVKKQRELLEQHLHILESTADLAGGMLWRKDKNGLYLFANRYHCRHFFGLPADCQDLIKGKSDLDLINSFIERTGDWHSFADSCAMTDAHCVTYGHRAAYVEVGRIGVSEKLLKIMKTPIFDQGSLVGIVGFALDMTFDCAGVFASLDAGIRAGNVEPLSPDTFWIKNPDQCAVDRRKPGQVMAWAKRMADRYNWQFSQSHNKSFGVGL